MAHNPEELHAARTQLLHNVVKYFRGQEGVKALFIAGSLAADTADEFSDIDFRVVVAPEVHQQFVANRLAAPQNWGEWLFNEWSEDSIFCVSHFKPFIKIDVFYLCPAHLQPSPWLTLPIQILDDPEDLLQSVITASQGLKFIPEPLAVNRLISKGIACAHETYRRAMRAEFLYAQSLLNDLRYCMVQADDYLLGHPPHSCGFPGFEQRGSREIVEAFSSSYGILDQQSILKGLRILLREYQKQIVQLHNRFNLERSLTSDLGAISLIDEWCQQLCSKS
jgi:hypothetical protein